MKSRFAKQHSLPLAVGLLVGIVSAATFAQASSVGTNFSADGTLSVTGASTLLGTTQIGTTTASPDGAALFVSGVSPVDIQSNFANGISMYTNNDAQFRAPYIDFYKSRGSFSTPTAVQYTGSELNSIGGINFGGYDGSSYTTGAAIYTNTDENWSPTDHGAHMSIYMTAVGQTTQKELAQFGGLDPSGVLGDNNGEEMLLYYPLNFLTNSATGVQFTPTGTGALRLTRGDGTTGVTFGVGTTSAPVANFQVANGNATTTVEFGSANENKGSCLKLYRTDGTAIYAYVAANATSFTLSTTACATVTNF